MGAGSFPKQPGPRMHLFYLSLVLFVLVFLMWVLSCEYGNHGSPPPRAYRGDSMSVFTDSYAVRIESYPVTQICTGLLQNSERRDVG